MNNGPVPINVIPGTPPPSSPLDAGFDFEHPSQYSSHQLWSAPLANSHDDAYGKGRLTCQTLYSGYVQGSTSPLLGSPISPSSSAHSLSPISRMLDDFSLDENPSGSPDETLMGSLYTEEQTMHSPSSVSLFGKAQASEGLHLRIPGGDHSSLDELFPPHPSAIDGFDGISLERSFQDFFELAGTIMDPSYSSDENYSNQNECDISPSASNFSAGSLSPSFYGPGSPSTFAPSPVSATSSALNLDSNASLSTVLPPADLLSDGSSLTQHRRSYSHSGVFSDHIHPDSIALFSACLLSPGDNVPDRRSGTLPHRRSYSNDCGAAGLASAVAPSLTSLLPPDSLPEGQSLLHRRHSHSNGTHPKMPENYNQPLRRTRSTTTVRNRSPYARNRDLPKDDFPASDRRGVPPASLQPIDPIWRGNRTPEPPSPSPSREDIFRTYDDRSGTGYPTLHRETIASDAVLLASAKRRKKVANYKCTTCGQLLTSRDNLNNHQDAHEGIRRHKCDYCHERFRTRSVLKRHQKSAKCPGSRLGPKKN